MSPAPPSTTAVGSAAPAGPVPASGAAPAFVPWPSSVSAAALGEDGPDAGDEHEEAGERWPQLALDLAR